jgi:TetR/AcrR family transcriptional regulator, transcriptional repressor for nem operon
MNGKTKPRLLAKQETREALIRAGMAAFSEDGVDLPSLDAICARAGFTRGAFYVHFKDREAFFAAVADQALQDFVNGVISAGESQGGVRGVVARFLTAVHEGKHTLGHPHKLLMQIAARGVQRGGADMPSYHVLIQGAIERVSAVAGHDQAQGVVKRDLDPAQLGLLLVASAVGFIVLSGGGFDPDIEDVRALCARWLFISGAAPNTDSGH